MTPDALSLRWDDTCHRIADLWPGRTVRVVPATDGGVGDVILDGHSATTDERAAMRRMLPDVRWSGWPAPVLALTLAGEVAAGYEAARRGTVLRASSEGRPVRLVAVAGGGPLLAVEVRS